MQTLIQNGSGKNIPPTVFSETMNDESLTIKTGRLGYPIYNSYLKRGFDIVVSVFLIVLFMPAMAAIALLISMDGGSVIYRHKRIGANGRAFHCLKFRTMVPNSAERLRLHLEADPEALREWTTHQKLKDDPRITSVGRYLRRSSLDELPQLFNVLLGTMSIVGPRPIVLDEVRRYGPRFVEYARCRPGLTGLWQVNRRNDTNYTRRVELDTLYHAHWSLRRDLYILLKTPMVVFLGRGAY